MQKPATDQLLTEFRDALLTIQAHVKALRELPIIPINGYYTSKQVKKLLQISEGTLARMREEKLIEYYQIGDFSFRYPACQFKLNQIAA